MKQYKRFRKQNDYNNLKGFVNTMIITIQKDS